MGAEWGSPAPVCSEALICIGKGHSGPLCTGSTSSPGISSLKDGGRKESVSEAVEAGRCGDVGMKEEKEARKSTYAEGI